MLAEDTETTPHTEGADSGLNSKMSSSRKSPVRPIWLLTRVCRERCVGRGKAGSHTKVIYTLTGGIRHSGGDTREEQRYLGLVSHWQADTGGVSTIARCLRRQKSDASSLITGVSRLVENAGARLQGGRWGQGLPLTHADVVGEQFCLRIDAPETDGAQTDSILASI